MSTIAAEHTALVERYSAGFQLVEDARETAVQSEVERLGGALGGIAIAIRNREVEMELAGESYETWVSPEAGKIQDRIDALRAVASRKPGLQKAVRTQVTALLRQAAKKGYAVS